jgi:very-short-patch-repair endonuclease
VPSSIRTWDGEVSVAPRSSAGRHPPQIWVPPSELIRESETEWRPDPRELIKDFRSGRSAVHPWDVDLQRVDRFARRHRGLLSFEESGLTRREWNAAIARGEGESRHRNVLRLYGAPTTMELEIEAAVLAAGSDALASHRSAALLWGAERPAGDPIDLILPQRNRQARLSNVVIHRPRDMRQLRPVWRHGIPTTDPLRTLLDLGAVDAGGVDAALVRFVVDGYVTPRAVRAALVRHSQHGRHGVVALRDALDRWSLDDKPADSDLEALMGEILVTYSLPNAEFHATVGGFEVDFWIVGSIVVIECDGWSAHGVDRDQFEFDRIRDAELSAQGFITLRTTWRQMTRNPRLVAKRIEALLARWSPEVLGPRST